MTDTQEITLRPVESGDASAMARLWWAAFYEKLGHVLGDHGPSFLAEWFSEDLSILQGTTVAVSSGTPVGYIHLSGQGRPSAGAAPGLWRVIRRHFGFWASVRRVFQFWISEWGNLYAGDTLYIYMIGVDDACRGQGIGGRLLTFAEEEARRQGKRRMKLGVIRKNTGAIRLYERFGFVKGPLHRTTIGGWAIHVPEYYEMVKLLDEPKGVSS